jgi:hypothetical protein
MRLPASTKAYYNYYSKGFFQLTGNLGNYFTKFIPITSCT